MGEGSWDEGRSSRAHLASDAPLRFLLFQPVPRAQSLERERMRRGDTPDLVAQPVPPASRWRWGWALQARGSAASEHAALHLVYMASRPPVPRREASGARRWLGAGMALAWG